MKTMSDPSPAVVARIKIASDYTAALIASIGWLSGVIAYALADTFKSGWWWVGVPAIAVIGSLLAIGVCRTHSFHVAAIATSQAREQ